MAKRQFEIQGSTLRIGGVDLEAGTTGVVIPGVTQATNFRVEEVEETGNIFVGTFNSVPVVIDKVTYDEYVASGSSTGKATYTAELAGLTIKAIEVDNEGSYTSAQASANNDMYAYTGSSGTPFSPFVSSDWTTIPFRPKMRAGNIETIGGGGNANIGDFTFANTTMSTPNEDIMLIQTTDNNSNLRTQMRFDPNNGIARMLARNQEQYSTYTTWTSATYTGTEINVVDSPSLVNFLNNGQFNYGTNKTFSVNGGNRLPYQGHSAGGNNATIYTSVTANPDPTTVTSMEFFWQLESKFEIDYDDGSMNINSTGMSIYIDNDQSQGPDIYIYSGDDITLQGKNKSLGSESEGGDINIYAGDGAGDDGAGNYSSSGGDIQIFAGDGGFGSSSSGSQGGIARFKAGTGGGSGVNEIAGQGGFVEIWAGAGGPNNGNTQLGAQGGYVDIRAGDTTLANNVGGNVSIRSGEGGDSAIAGNVQIITPSSSLSSGGTWTFDGNGVTQIPGLIQGNGNVNISIDSAFTTANQLFRFRGGDIASHLHFDTSDNSQFDLYVGDDDQYVKVSKNGTIDIGTENPTSYNNYTWSFDTEGQLNVPGPVAAAYTAQVGQQFANIPHWDTAGANLYTYSNVNAVDRPDVDAVAQAVNVGWSVQVSDGNDATIVSLNSAGYFSFETNVPLTGTGTLTFTSPGYQASQPTDLVLKAGTNQVRLTGAGHIDHAGMVRTFKPVSASVGAGVSGTIWDTNLDVQAVKFLVHGVETTTNKSQSCEVLITKDANDDLAVTVYALVHTSANPLFTLDAAYNNGTGVTRLDASIPGANNVGFTVHVTAIYYD